MAHRIIPIPGGTTVYEDAPQVEIVRQADALGTIIVQYNAVTNDQPPLTGQIKFLNVSEYRWIASDAEYEDISIHEEDFEFGLIEIINSAYVENMAAKGVRKNFTGQLFGIGIPETDVKHFRLAFEDHGRSDVIAFDVQVNQVNSV